MKRHSLMILLILAVLLLTACTPQSELEEAWENREESRCDSSAFTPQSELEEARENREESQRDSSAFTLQSELEEARENREESRCDSSACATRSGLEEAREKWNAHGIIHYRMTVQHIESIWHMQIYEIEVNGDEISHSVACSPAPSEGGICEIKEYDPADYTVAGLFDTARGLLKGEHSEWVKVEYNKEYGFPTFILIDDHEVLDEDNIWGITEFEVLP